MRKEAHGRFRTRYILDRFDALPDRLSRLEQRRDRHIWVDHTKGEGALHTITGVLPDPNFPDLSRDTLNH
jgi:hypothetical protein